MNLSLDSLFCSHKKFTYPYRSRINYYNFIIHLTYHILLTILLTIPSNISSEYKWVNTRNKTELKKKVIRLEIIWYHFFIKQQKASKVQKYIVLSYINRWSLLRQGNHPIKLRIVLPGVVFWGWSQRGWDIRIHFGSGSMGVCFTIMFHDLYVLAKNSKPFRGP